MKKIVTGIAALAVASSMFAVDISAKVTMEGKILSGSVKENTEKTKLLKAGKAEGSENKDDYYEVPKMKKTGVTSADFNAFTLDAKGQKYGAEAMTISANAGKAGAQIQFIYDYPNGAISATNTNLWFKPVDSMKVTAGFVEYITYREMISWWKVANGATASAKGFSSYATVSGQGLSVEWTPISGLELNVAIDPGTANAFFKGKNLSKYEPEYEMDGDKYVLNDDGTKKIKKTAEEVKKEYEKGSYSKWGASLKYSLAGMGLPMSVAVSYRDSGDDNDKIAAVGLDYGNNWGEGFYGFLNARLRFEKSKLTYVEKDQYEQDVRKVEYTPDAVTLQGIALDNYLKFSAGKFKALARIPVTLRGFAIDKNWATKYNVKAEDMDPSYLQYELKLSYAMNGITPYVDIMNDNAVTFNSKFGETALDMNIKPGVTFSVGSVNFDIGLDLNIPNNETAGFEWAVPFNAQINF